MSVTEQLMGWGSWSVTLKGEPDDTTPGSIWEALDPATNAYGHVLVTPTRVNPDAVGDAGMLSMAKYTGIYRGNAARNQIGGIGLVGWLGDEDDKGDIAETAVTGTGGGGFDDWITDIIPTSLTEGTVTVIAGTLAESMKYMSPRQMLARVMDYFGGVYRVNPDFTLDAGTEDDLFDTDPVVLLKYNASGPDATVRGIRASKIDLARDLEDYTTEVILLAEGQGDAVQLGSATLSPATSFKDGLGNAVILKRLVNAPDVSSANADTLAAAQLGRFNDLRKAYSLSTSEWGVIFGDTKRLEPGDYIWVYDPRPDAALFDTANQITFQGQVLMPVKLRLEAITWPIQEGMGVYFRYFSGATATYVDLSNHVVYETGETTLDVGAAQRKLTTDPTPAQIQMRTMKTSGKRVDFRGSNQAILNNTTTIIIFDNIDIEAGLSMSRTSGVYTVNRAGYWRVAAQAQFAANTTGRRELEIHVNGSLLAKTRMDPPGAGDNFQQVVSPIQELAASDTIDIRVYQLSGGNLNIIGASMANTWVSFEWMGPA